MMTGRHLFVSLAFLLVTPFFANAEEQCTIAKIASVPMRTDNWDIPTVQVQINGEEADFFVDTATPFPLISYEAATEMKLVLSSIESNYIPGYGGRLINLRTTVRDFKLGGASAERVGMFVIPGGVLPPTISGVFAPALTEADIDFDFGDKTLNLLRTEHCTTEVIYWSNGPVASIPLIPRTIAIEAKLDGKPVEAIINTGTSISSMDLSSARFLFGSKVIDDAKQPDERPAFPSPKEDYSNSTFYTYPFSELLIEGVSIKNPKIKLVKRSFPKRGVITLGSSILKNFHLYIAYNQKRIYLTTAQAQ